MYQHGYKNVCSIFLKLSRFFCNFVMRSWWVTSVHEMHMPWAMWWFGVVTTGFLQSWMDEQSEKMEIWWLDQEVCLFVKPTGLVLIFDLQTCVCTYLCAFVFVGMLVDERVYVCVLHHIKVSPLFAIVHVVVVPGPVFATASCGYVAQPV